MAGCTVPTCWECLPVSQHDYPCPRGARCTPVVLTCIIPVGVVTIFPLSICPSHSTYQNFCSKLMGSSLKGIPFILLLTDSGTGMTQFCQGDRRSGLLKVSGKMCHLLWRNDKPEPFFVSDGLSPHCWAASSHDHSGQTWNEFSPKDGALERTHVLHSVLEPPHRHLEPTLPACLPMKLTIFSSV